MESPATSGWSSRAVIRMPLTVGVAATITGSALARDVGVGPQSGAGRAQPAHRTKAQLAATNVVSLAIPPVIALFSA